MPASASNTRASRPAGAIPAAVAAGASRCGERHDVNQDAWVAIPEIGLFAVADGVGACRGADVAARESLAAVEGSLRARPQALAEARSAAQPQRMVELLLEAVQYANDTVFELSGSSEAMEGTACTLTAVLLGSSRAALAHVGDSRAYIVRGGVCHQLTRDHTVAQDLLAAGALTPTQAANHRFRSMLTRSIGRGRRVAVDALELEVFGRDAFVICSDGVSKTLTSASDLAGCLTAAPPQAAAWAAVALAVERGERDDITAVVARVPARRGLGGLGGI